MSGNDNGQDSNPDHRPTLENVDSEYTPSPTPSESMTWTPFEPYRRDGQPLDELIHGNYPKHWLTPTAKKRIGSEKCLLFLIYVAHHWNRRRGDAFPSLVGFAEKHLDGNTRRASEIATACERAGLITRINPKRQGVKVVWTFERWYIIDESPDESNDHHDQQGSREGSREGSPKKSREGSRLSVNEPKGISTPVPFVPCVDNQTKPTIDAEQLRKATIEIQQRRPARHDAQRKNTLKPFWKRLVNYLSNNINPNQIHLVGDLKYAAAFNAFEKALANYQNDVDGLADEILQHIEPDHATAGAVVNIMDAIGNVPRMRPIGHGGTSQRLPCTADNCPEVIDGNHAECSGFTHVNNGREVNCNCNGNQPPEPPF